MSTTGNPSRGRVCTSAPDAARSGGSSNETKNNPDRRGDCLRYLFQHPDVGCVDGYCLFDGGCVRDTIDMAREAGLRSAVLLRLYGTEDALCDSEIEELRQIERLVALVRADERALAAPVQEPFDHQQAASTALRESMNRSNAIAKNTVPTLQKRPQNCGTGYCSCVECVMEPAVPDAFGTREGEHPQYVQGWNDCRAETLKMRKP